jgi:hypothetical protein
MGEPTWIVPLARLETGSKVTQQGTSLRALRAAGVAGLVFAVLMTTSLALFSLNDPDATGAAGGVPAGVKDSWLVALYMIPFAGIAFVWFLAALRRRIGRLEDQFFATVFLGSGLLFVAMLFATGAVASATVAASRLGTDPANQAVFEFGKTLAASLFYVFAVKMAAAFMLVSSTIGRRTGFLPRWLVAAGLVAGLVMLFSVSFFEVLAITFPVWVAVVSGLLLRADPNAWSAS